MTVWLSPRDTNYARLRRHYGGPEAPPRATTVVSLQEQMKGWLSKIHRARTPAQVIRGYSNLLEAFDGFKSFEILPFDAPAQARFDDFKRQKLRVSTLDLRIACIALVHGAA